jgi:formylglycine-generating enzyme required for sulfatase activity
MARRPLGLRIPRHACVQRSGYWHAPNLAANLEPTDKDYVASCRSAEQAVQARTRRVQALVGVLVAAMVAVLAVWRYEQPLKEEIYWLTDVRAHVLTAERERALRPKEPFKECVNCPEMVVVPAGEFMMGSPSDEKGRNDNEAPVHKVTIAKPFAVAKFELTFDEWDTCAAHGDCDPNVSDGGWGRGRQPVINVSWDDARRDVAWLSRITGQPYRLLTEAEWEYAARAGTTTRYSFGDDEAALGQYAWSRANSDRKTHPVGEKKPNAFGLYDMHGNVWEWVQDCYHYKYDKAPKDGSAVDPDGD